MNKLSAKFSDDFKNGKIKALRESGMLVGAIAELYNVSRTTVSTYLNSIEIYWPCKECGKKYLVGKNDMSHLCNECRAFHNLEQKKRPEPPSRRQTLNLSIDDIIAIQNYTRRLTGKYYSYGKISAALYGGNRRYKIEH